MQSFLFYSINLDVSVFAKSQNIVPVPYAVFEISFEASQTKSFFRQKKNCKAGVSNLKIARQILKFATLKKIVVFILLTDCRVPTRPGKAGKMRVHLENLEIWNFEKFNKYHGKMT